MGEPTETGAGVDAAYQGDFSDNSARSIGTSAWAMAAGESGAFAYGLLSRKPLDTPGSSMSAARESPFLRWLPIRCAALLKTRALSSNATGSPKTGNGRRIPSSCGAPAPMGLILSPPRPRLLRAVRAQRRLSRKGSM
jgi:hypothetical protein